MREQEWFSLVNKKWVPTKPPQFSRGGVKVSRFVCVGPSSVSNTKEEDFLRHSVPAVFGPPEDDE